MRESAPKIFEGDVANDSTESGYISYEQSKSFNTFEHLKRDPQFQRQVDKIINIETESREEQEKFTQEIDDLMITPSEIRRKAQETVEQEDDERREILRWGTELLDLCNKHGKEIYLSDIPEEKKKEFDALWRSLTFYIDEDHLGPLVDRVVVEDAKHRAENTILLLVSDPFFRAAGLITPESVRRSPYYKNLASAAGRIIPESFQGNLYLDDLKSCKGLIIPESFQGNLFLNGLESAKNLIIPESFQGNLFLNGLRYAEDLVIPESFRGNLSLNGLPPDQINYLRHHNPRLRIYSHDYTSKYYPS